MNKKGYYEYDPVIYPRKVWVHIGTNFKELASEIFEGELIFDDKTCDGGVFEMVGCLKMSLERAMISTEYSPLSQALKK